MEEIELIATSTFGLEAVVKRELLDLGYGELIEVNVNIGEEIAHPNTFEHHISWMKVYFKPEGAKFPVEIGNYNFAAHGEQELFTEPYITLKFKAEKSGTIFATSYCNIHGLWENSQELAIED